MRVQQLEIQNSIFEAKNLAPSEFLKRTTTIRELVPEKVDDIKVAGFEDGNAFEMMDMNGYEKGDGDF